MGEDRDAILQHITYLRDDVARGMSGVHERLDRLDGRVRTTETSVEVIKDRHAQAGRSGAKWGTAAGAAVAGLLTALWQLLGWSK